MQHGTSVTSCQSSRVVVLLMLSIMWGLTLRLLAVDQHKTIYVKDSTNTSKANNSGKFLEPGERSTPAKEDSSIKSDNSNLDHSIPNYYQLTEDGLGGNNKSSFNAVEKELVPKVISSSPESMEGEFVKFSGDAELLCNSSIVLDKMSFICQLMPKLTTYFFITRLKYSRKGIYDELNSVMEKQPPFGGGCKFSEPEGPSIYYPSKDKMQLPCDC